MKSKISIALVVLALLVAAAPSIAQAGFLDGGDCCCAPPVNQKLCVTDPCTGCTQEVCVCVPACCCNEDPCVSCRPGLFGRQVLTYCWPCCGHTVKVVITSRGDVRVRE
jgi:hypothetical protein